MPEIQLREPNGFNTVIFPSNKLTPLERTNARYMAQFNFSGLIMIASIMNSSPDLSYREAFLELHNKGDL